MATESASATDTPLLAVLRQFDAERRQQNAIVAEDVRARAQQWSNEHPHLRLEVENPQLAAEVQQAGVVLDRQVNDPVFREYMRTELGMAELQAMSDDELRFTLRNRLTPRDATEAEKHIRGDQSGVTISQLTKALAIDSGVIPASAIPETDGFKAPQGGFIDGNGDSTDLLPNVQGDSVLQLPGVN